MMMKWRIVEAFAFLAAISSAFGRTEEQQVQCGVPGSVTNYIMGGDETGPLEFPWQISLQLFNTTINRWEHICSGSIIDKHWIFTAAHCLDTRKLAGELRVAIGAHNIRSLEKLASIQDVVRSRDLVIHPMWSGLDQFDYDYALIQFATPLDFAGTHKHVRPICMPKADQNFEGMDCVVSGWGLTTNSGDIRDQPDVLQKLPVHVTPFKECAFAWRHNGADKGSKALTSRHICVATKRGEGTGPCRGDSGGPLECMIADRYVLAGAMSFPRDCGSSDYPTIYARITEVLEWVDRVKAIRTRE